MTYLTSDDCRALIRDTLSTLVDAVRTDSPDLSSVLDTLADNIVSCIDGRIADHNLDSHIRD